MSEAAGPQLGRVCPAQLGSGPENLGAEMQAHCPAWELGRWGHGRASGWELGAWGPHSQVLRGSTSSILPREPGLPCRGAGPNAVARLRLLSVNYVLSALGPAHQADNTHHQGSPWLLMVGETEASHMKRDD